VCAAAGCLEALLWIVKSNARRRGSDGIDRRIDPSASAQLKGPGSDNEYTEEDRKRESVFDECCAPFVPARCAAKEAHNFGSSEKS